MRPVHVISLLVLLVAIGACRSSSDGLLPPIFTEPPPADTRPLKEPVPNGFVAGPEEPIFHRADCPRAKGLDPRTREFYDTPYRALDQQYAPCDYCEPFAGWH